MFLSQDSRAEVDEGAEVVEEVCEELRVAVALEEEHHEEGGEVRREEEEADEDEDNEMAHSILSVISFTCGSCKSFKAARFLYFSKRLLKIRVNTNNVWLTACAPFLLELLLILSIEFILFLAGEIASRQGVNELKTFLELFVQAGSLNVYH